MKPLLIAILILIFTLSVSGQQFPAEVVSDPVPVKKLNWLERRYRETNTGAVRTAEQRLAAAREKMDATVAAPNYQDQQRDIFIQKDEVAVLQKSLDAARDQLTRYNELLIKSLASKDVRKRFNKELQSALEKENRETAAKYSKYPSTYRSFRVDCYSGGYGRHFWVRCTSTSY